MTRVQILAELSELGIKPDSLGRIRKSDLKRVLAGGFHAEDVERMSDWGLGSGVPHLLELAIHCIKKEPQIDQGFAAILEEALSKCNKLNSKLKPIEQK